MSAPQPLPWHARAALVTCTLLAALVGLGASEDLMRLRRLSEIELLLPRSALIPPEVVQKAEAVARASLFGMRGSRMTILVLLSIACTVTFIAVLRLWRPLGLPRAGVLRLTSFTALGCALLRTIDGAQQAVVFRRIATALAQGLASGAVPVPGDPETVKMMTRVLPDLEVAVRVAWTLVVAGTFVALSQYFRSQLAQKLFTTGDPTPP